MTGTSRRKDSFVSRIGKPDRVTSAVDDVSVSEATTLGAGGWVQARQAESLRPCDLQVAIAFVRQSRLHK